MYTVLPFLFAAYSATVFDISIMSSSSIMPGTIVVLNSRNGVSRAAIMPFLIFSMVSAVFLSGRPIAVAYLLILFSGAFMSIATWSVYGLSFSMASGIDAFVS